MPVDRKPGSASRPRAAAKPAAWSTPDRRSFQRAKTVKTGEIVYGDNGVMDCVILDLSDGGAKLKPADILLCPERFKLHIKFGPTYNCEAVRQLGSSLHVRFVD